MANNYCNLDGSKKIKDEFKKINVGFDKVEIDINLANSKIDTNLSKVSAVTNDLKNIIVTPAEGVSEQEIIQARQGENTLNDRLNKMEEFVDAQLSAIVSGTPKGTYADLNALIAAYPDGADGVFLVLENGHWYYWANGAWVDGGVYQSTVSDDFSATNEATNGNFENGTTGWAATGGTLTALNNALIFTATTLVASSRIETTADNTIANNKYYMSAEIYPKYSNVTYFSIGDSSNINVQRPFSPKANSWNKISNIETAVNNSRFRMYHRPSTNYVEGDTIKYRNIVVINLTKTFGVGNEPTVKEMDKILSKYPSSYFEGTTGTLLNNRDIYIYLKDVHDVLGLNSYTTVPTYVDGILTKVEELDGGTVMSRTSITYNAAGDVSKVIEETRRQTVSSVLNYVNGVITSVSKTVTGGGL